MNNNKVDAIGFLVLVLFTVIAVASCGCVTPEVTPKPGNKLMEELHKEKVKADWELRDWIVACLFLQPWEIGTKAAYICPRLMPHRKRVGL